MMEWQEYPAGAHLRLFDGGFYVWVIQNKSSLNWEVIIYGTPPEYGIRIVEFANSKEEAKRKAESWLKNHMAKYMED